MEIVLFHPLAIVAIVPIKLVGPNTAVFGINVVNIGLTCFNMNKKSVYLIHYSMEWAFACYNESTSDRKVLVETSVL